MFNRIPKAQFVITVPGLLQQEQIGQERVKYKEMTSVVGRDEDRIGYGEIQDGRIIVNNKVIRALDETGGSFRRKAQTSNGLSAENGKQRNNQDDFDEEDDDVLERENTEEADDYYNNPFVRSNIEF